MEPRTQPKLGSGFLYWRPVRSASAVTKPVLYKTPAIAAQLITTIMMNSKVKNLGRTNPLGMMHPKDVENLTFVRHLHCTAEVAEQCSYARNQATTPLRCCGSLSVKKRPASRGAERKALLGSILSRKPIRHRLQRDAHLSPNGKESRSYTSAQSICNYPQSGGWELRSKKMLWHRTRKALKKGSQNSLS